MRKISFVLAILLCGCASDREEVVDVNVVNTSSSVIALTINERPQGSHIQGRDSVRLKVMVPTRSKEIVGAPGRTDQLVVMRNISTGDVARRACVLTRGQNTLTYSIGEDGKGRIAC